MWDERYSEGGFAYGTEPNDFLKEMLPTLSLPSGSKALLLADGEGRNGVFCAESGLQVTAVDVSQVGLDKAAALAETRGVKIETVQADLASYDIGNDQYDLIVGISCHLPPPVRLRVLEAIPKALKKGGYVLFECYTPAQIEFKTGGPPVPELMYTSQIFREAFDGQLEIQRNSELVRDVVEGKYHAGKAAVVQFLGRRL
jgi:SAM-dependent methyltransferase